MQTDHTQWTILNDCITNFLHDRQAAGHSSGSIYFYRMKLRLLQKYCESSQITRMTELTPDVLRAYLIQLSAEHSQGGVHACFRALRAFLYWWEQEYEPENWRNPLHKIRKPRQPQDILDPASIEAIQAMVNTCKSGEIDDREVWRLTENCDDLDDLGDIILIFERKKPAVIKEVTRITESLLYEQGLLDCVPV